MAKLPNIQQHPRQKRSSSPIHAAAREEKLDGTCSEGDWLWLIAIVDAWLPQPDYTQKKQAACGGLDRSAADLCC
jgi:hypothetical protein